MIDEFPRLVAAHPSIASYLQMVWDMELQHTQVFLALTGSLLSVMRQQVLDPDAPLYLRHSWPFKLKPLTVADLPAFFPTYAPAELVETYAVLGGMPYYLISVDPTVDLQDFVEKHSSARTRSHISGQGTRAHHNIWIARVPRPGFSTESC